jgi:hypothetical protein
MIFIYNTPTTELPKVGKNSSRSSRPTSGQNKTVSINRPASKAGKKRDSIPSYNWSDAIERSVNENPMIEAGRQNRAWLKGSSRKKRDTVKIVNMHILKNVA